MLVDLWVVQGQVHQFDPSHVWCLVLLETARHEAPACINAGKDAVGSAWTVHPGASSDIVDGVVDGKVDRLVRIGTVVLTQLLRREVLRPVLLLKKSSQ